MQITKEQRVLSLESLKGFEELLNKQGESFMSERVRERYYIDGSTVRKVREVSEVVERPRRSPERTPQRSPQRAPQRRENPKVNKKISAKADRALAFDMKYTMFVMASILIVICACVFMLHMESAINERKSNINALENELETIEDDNAALKLSLESMYSLDEIYDVATNELGMVYARKGQIVYYESANEDYVKQFQDIPE